jgi:hypothetical protein
MMEVFFFNFVIWFWKETALSCSPCHKVWTLRNFCLPNILWFESGVSLIWICFNTNSIATVQVKEHGMLNCLKHIRLLQTPLKISLKWRKQCGVVIVKKDCSFQTLVLVMQTQTATNDLFSPQSLSDDDQLPKENRTMQSLFKIRSQHFQKKIHHFKTTR